MAKIKMALITPDEVVVAVPGTPVPLSATPVLVNNLSIQWKPTNSGDVYVGDNDVDDTNCILLNATTPAVSLVADDSAADEDDVFYDLSEIFIDAANAGDRVLVSYTVMSSLGYNGG